MRTIALDTETTGVNFKGEARPFYISTCDDNGGVKSWRFKVDPFTRDVRCSSDRRNEIAAYIRGTRLVYHNAKFDIAALQSIGIDPGWDNYEDTLLASHAVSSGQKHGLKDLASRYFGISDLDQILLQKQVILACNQARDLGWKLGFDSKGSRQTAWDYWVPGQIWKDDNSLATYGDKDVERTMLLWLTYKDVMEEEDLVEGYKVEKQLQQVIYKMESCGLSIDMRRLREARAFLEKESTDFKDNARAVVFKKCDCDININSSKQMRELLYEKFKLPVKHRTKKAKEPATDKTALGALFDVCEDNSEEGEFIKNVLGYRGTSTGVRYMKGYQQLAIYKMTNWFKIYPSMNQSATKTGRLASKNPNGQNVGKKDKVKFAGEVLEIPKLRDCFCPPPGKVWYSIDYSQIEIRVFATLSGEQSILDALDAGYDFHGFVASRIFNKNPEEVTDSERTIAKNTNFAIIFGAGPNKVNETAGISNAYELFSGQFPNVTSFMESTIRGVSKTGRLRTADNYRLDVPLDAPYKSVNYLVQGTAGRIIKKAMVALDKEEWFDWKDIKMILQVHDELIFEINKHSNLNNDETLRKIMNVMEAAGSNMGINTPVSCERITNDWGHGEEISV
jgi:DNA polymerase-1